MTLKPLVFVAMPFGKKHSDNVEIDFDQIYNNAIKPAASKCDVEIIRADEERTGGIIHRSMYERLLLAEVVIADLTMANPNVFYELGIRHCARPKSTILIFAANAKLPFDVSPLRAIPYHLEDGGNLSEESARDLQRNLEKKIAEVKEENSMPDSPLFQLVQKFPGITLPHDATEVFRDRAKYIDSIRSELEVARCIKPTIDGLSEIQSIESRIGDFNLAPSELLIDLMLSYRDVSSWNDMVRVAENFPINIKNIRTVQEQLALALNRRKQGNDQDRAIEILRRIIDTNGASPETCGILGRVYKDISSNAKKAGDMPRARAALDESIACYCQGFREDPRDYYPGINALTLLFHKGGDDAKKTFDKLYPLVKFAIGRRGGLASRDYWDLATVLEFAILGRDWVMARNAADKLILNSKSTFNLETTRDNLKIILDRLRDFKEDTKPLDLIISDLDKRIVELKGTGHQSEK
ncbi:MAG: TRAFs-binding domain-containing protein [Methanothrix sp.]